MEELQRELQRFCQRQLAPDQDARVKGLTAISDGWETEVHSFDLVRETRSEGRILRMYPGDDAVEKSAHEFEVLRQLHQAGYPVPEVFWHEPTGGVLGKPFLIMERIEGQSLGTAFRAASEERQGSLFTRFCGLAADLHALDWRPFASDTPPGDRRDLAQRVAQQLAELQTRVRKFGQTDFDPLFDWLHSQTNQIHFGEPALIHGDFHPHNVLLRADDAVFVIDWGNARILDHRVDLAFTIILSFTHGRPDLKERFLDDYARLSGRAVEHIEYFEVVACVVRLFNMVASLGEGADRLGMRPGAEALMRRSFPHFRQVYALLLDQTGIRLPIVERLLAE